MSEKKARNEVRKAFVAAAKKATARPVSPKPRQVGHRRPMCSKPGCKKLWDGIVFYL